MESKAHVYATMHSGPDIFMFTNLAVEGPKFSANSKLKVLLKAMIGMFSIKFRIVCDADCTSLAPTIRCLNYFYKVYGSFIKAVKRFKKGDGRKFGPKQSQWKVFPLCSL